MITIATFEQWQEAKIEDTPLTFYVTCPDCDGTGADDDECPYCVRSDEDGECELCDGNGDVQIGELTPAQVKTVFNKTAYLKDLFADLGEYEKATGRIKAFEVMAENGYFLNSAVVSRYSNGVFDKFQAGKLRVTDDSGDYRIQD